MFYLKNRKFAKVEKIILVFENFNLSGENVCYNATWKKRQSNRVHLIGMPKHFDIYS